MERICIFVSVGYRKSIRAKGLGGTLFSRLNVETVAHSMVEFIQQQSNSAQQNQMDVEANTEAVC